VKEDFVTHGKMSERPNWKHCRECAVHGQHGALYACPEYSFAVLAEIGAAKAEWCQKQRAGGVSPTLLKLFRVMRGIGE
jgi:hypothetical protein